MLCWTSSRALVLSFFEYLKSPQKSCFRVFRVPYYSVDCKPITWLLHNLNILSILCRRLVCTTSLTCTRSDFNMHSKAISQKIRNSLYFSFYVKSNHFHHCFPEIITELLHCTEFVNVVAGALNCLWYLCHLFWILSGRYNKYSRELSQSPWIIDGERKGLDTSVSELLADPLIEYTNAESEYRSTASNPQTSKVCFNLEFKGS